MSQYKEANEQFAIAVECIQQLKILNINLNHVQSEQQQLQSESTISVLDSMGYELSVMLNQAMSLYRAGEYEDCLIIVDKCIQTWPSSYKTYSLHLLVNRCTTRIANIENDDDDEELDL